MSIPESPASPAVIHDASASPTPPPCDNPAMTPQATQKPRSPRIGPTSGLPSGANVNGPLTTRRIPIVPMAG
jgi:hypothetical protein